MSLGGIPIPLRYVEILSGVFLPFISQVRITRKERKRETNYQEIHFHRTSTTGISQVPTLGVSSSNERELVRDDRGSLR